MLHTNRSVILGETYQPTEVVSSWGLCVLGALLPCLPVTGDELQHSPGKLLAPLSVALILTADRMHVKQKLLQRIVYTTPLQTHMPPSTMAGPSTAPDAGGCPLAPLGRAAPSGAGCPHMAIGFSDPSRGEEHDRLWQCVILPQHSSLICDSAITPMLPQRFARLCQFPIMFTFQFPFTRSSAGTNASLCGSDALCTGCECGTRRFGSG